MDQKILVHRGEVFTAVCVHARVCVCERENPCRVTFPRRTCLFLSFFGVKYLSFYEVLLRIEGRLSIFFLTWHN